MPELEREVVDGVFDQSFLQFLVCKEKNVYRVFLDLNWNAEY